MRILLLVSKVPGLLRRTILSLELVKDVWFPLFSQQCYQCLTNMILTNPSCLYANVSSDEIQRSLRRGLLLVPKDPEPLRMYVFFAGTCERCLVPTLQPTVPPVI